MSKEIKIKGLEEVLESVDNLADVKAYERALAKACALVERTAKEKAPKGNGELRRSIQSRIENEGDRLIGVIFTPLEYAPYVEYGTGLFAEEGGRTDVPWVYQDEKGEWHTTSGMKPQPYLRPALNENREEILRLLKEGKDG
jgi:HK97 gp10 family phage protein